MAVATIMDKTEMRISLFFGRKLFLDSAALFSSSFKEGDIGIPMGLNGCFIVLLLQAAMPDCLLQRWVSVLFDFFAKIQIIHF